MKKNSGKNFINLQVDPLSGNYCVIIPEWVANELSWYEDTEISLSVEGDELILKEREDE
jgi:antitoxin component of MazEF toxin-antitoxin module